MKTIKAKHTHEVPYTYTGMVEFPSGTKFWFKNGKLHREDGPAIIRDDGNVEYWIDDKPITKEAQEMFGWLFPKEE